MYFRALKKNELNKLFRLNELTMSRFLSSANSTPKLKLVGLLVALIFSLDSNAQVVFENPITGANPNTSNPYILGQSFNSNVTVSGIGRGSGITGSNGNNRYSANNWTQGASSDNNDYFYWTLTPTACNEIDFSSLAISFERNANGPQNFALRSSIDNYASDVLTFSNNTTTVQSQTVSLNAAVFQNIIGPITFRIYGWSSTSGTGTFSINSFAFNGAVNAATSPVAGVITGSSSVCSGTSTSLTLAGSTGNIQWQTSSNNISFSNIGGATSSNYSTANLSSTQYYRAAVTLGNCPTVFSPSFAVSITPFSITPTGASSCGPASLVLSANSVCQPANTTIQWYTSQVGGSPIASGINFTTPVLNSTTTYFVSSNVIGGNTTVAADESDQSGLGLIFNATSEMLLNSVQVESEGTGFVTVQVFGPGGASMANIPPIVFPLANGLNTLNLGWLIPVGNGYRLVATVLSHDVHLTTTTENFSWPFSLGAFGSITGQVGSTNQYAYFYNWNISSPRIPVTATISQNTNVTSTISACDSYTWNVNGTAYTTSGTYTSVTGCHTETLVLTITSSTNNTTTASACDTYTWSVNGTTYTASGTYTSVTGCHTETLVLTITPSTNNTTTASACDSYTWSVNGTTYNTSGTYTSVTGCHTETLVLTINASSIYYLDADGDGFGSTTTANFCTAPSSGYSLNSTDCNDASATVYPGAPELCNSVDDNCNGFTDEGCPSTIAGEEPFNALLAPSTYYSYCNSFYGTLAGAFPSDFAKSTCETGEDVWYSFTAITSGITIFIGSNANDIIIELQDVNGILIEVENSVSGPGTEVLSTNNLIPGADYRFGIRNKNSHLNPGGAFSACVRHLRRGGSDSGTSGTWPSTLSTCSLFKAIYCGGTGVQYRYIWTGISGSATGQVFTKTQTSDYLNVTAVTPSLHAGSTYNVLVTAIYSIPNGTGAIEVFELTAYEPSSITILPAANVALRSSDQLSNGPRYRGSVIAALPWVCGITNWRWRFTEVNPLTLQAVGLPIEQNRAAASNFINLNTVAALQFGKTYAVQSSPIFTYTGTNYQWGPVTYMAIIGSAGMTIDPTEGASQGSEKDALQGPSEGVSQGAMQEMELSVFPNPSNGSDLNLNISGIESDNVQVKVYDTLGRKIESKRYVVDGTLQTTLNFANELSNGLYILEVTTEDVKRSIRFMVEQ